MQDLNRLIWCSKSESNRHCSAFEVDDSTNWPTRAYFNKFLLWIKEWRPFNISQQPPTAKITAAKIKVTGQIAAKTNVITIDSTSGPLVSSKVNPNPTIATKTATNAYNIFLFFLWKPLKP